MVEGRGEGQVKPRASHLEAPQHMTQSGKYKKFLVLAKPISKARQTRS